MTGSTIARVLVALCIGSAVNCMPRGTHRGRRQSQQHHASSVSQGEFIYFYFFVLKVISHKFQFTVWGQQRSPGGQQRVGRMMLHFIS